MIKSLYLYEDPFVVPDTAKNRLEYLSQTVRLTDFEREDEELVRSLILKFMIDHQLVKITDTEADSNPGQNSASINWFINWHNFRSIIVQREYDNMLMTLESSDGEFINTLIDLHGHLGMRVDHTLLNTIITRTMRSIQIIPYAVSNKDKSISWNDIFITLPFIWIVIMIQAIIRSDTKAK